MMPRLDGWMTATRLRGDESTSHIKVVLITARAQEEDRKRGLGIGVDAYLTKPFDPAELIEVVRGLAEQAKASQQG
jgi:DNA-binding response OmpR family regulator